MDNKLNEHNEEYLHVTTCMRVLEYSAQKYHARIKALS